MTLLNPIKCPILLRDVPFLYLILTKRLSSNVQSNIRLLSSNVQSTLKYYNKIRNEREESNIRLLSSNVQSTLKHYNKIRNERFCH